MAKPKPAPRPPAPREDEPRYIPSPAEAEALRAYREHRRARPAAPRARVRHRPPQPARIDPDHPDPEVWRALLKAALGTTEDALAGHLLGQLTGVTRSGGAGEPIAADALNAALAVLHGAAPRDETEALLCVQMLATHEAAMDFLRRAVQGEYHRTIQDCGNLAVKLLRTYALQLEALRRYRGGGEQRIIVERVTVTRGGQAVVDPVEAPGGGGGTGVLEKTQERAHAQQQHQQQLAHAPEPEVRRPNPERRPMPVTGGEG